MTTLRTPGPVFPAYNAVAATRNPHVANTSPPQFGASQPQQGERSLWDILGPNRTHIQIKQAADIANKNTIQDCYFLAIIDILLHHPQANALLGLFTQQALPGTNTENCYQIRFPSGRRTVVSIPKTQDQDGYCGTNIISLPGFSRQLKGITSNSREIRLLERAFIQMRYEDVQAKHSKARTERDKQNNNPLDTSSWLNVRTAAEALNLMFASPTGERTLPDIAFNQNYFALGGELHSYPPTTPVPKAKRASQPEQSPHKHSLSQHFSTLNQAAEPDILLALIQSNGLKRARDIYGKSHSFLPNHYYAIRQDASNGDVITLADPFDNQTDVFSLPLGEFARIFSVEGCRLKDVLPVTGHSQPYYRPLMTIFGAKKRKSPSTVEETPPGSAKHPKYYAPTASPLSGSQTLLKAKAQEFPAHWVTNPEKTPI